MERRWRLLVSERTKIAYVSAGILLILCIVLAGCSGSAPQQEAGQKTPANTPTPPPTPTVQLPQPTPQGMPLRSKPLQVSENDLRKVFGVDENWRPLTYFKHNFENQRDVVVDRATGLMWQKSGSAEPMQSAQAQAYIAQLNQQRFAGYANWRLPTMAELLALVEPQPQAAEWYLNLLFDQKQTWCWSADTLSVAEAWAVNFQRGSVNWLTLTNCYVRAVRF